MSGSSLGVRHRRAGPVAGGADVAPARYFGRPGAWCIGPAIANGPANHGSLRGSLRVSFALLGAIWGTACVNLWPTSRATVASAPAGCARLCSRASQGNGLSCQPRHDPRLADCGESTTFPGSRPGRDGVLPPRRSGHFTWSASSPPVAQRWPSRLRRFLPRKVGAAWPMCRSRHRRKSAPMPTPCSTMSPRGSNRHHSHDVRTCKSSRLRKHPPRRYSVRQLRSARPCMCPGSWASTRRRISCPASTIEEQTRQALTNCQSILRAAGAELANVVEVCVLLARPSDFSGLNEEYAKCFPKNPPTRAVAKLGVEVPNLLVSIKNDRCALANRRPAAMPASPAHWWCRSWRSSY